MTMKFDLASGVTLSDNITRLRMQGAQLHDPQVLEQLVSVTRANGISANDMNDLRRIRANLLRQGDPAAEAFFALPERLLDAQDREALAATGRTPALGQLCQNRLPSMAWRDDLELTGPQRERHMAHTTRLQDQIALNPRLGGARGRVFHQKQLWARLCKMSIRRDLPGFVQAGGFTEPGELPVVMRFSNGQGVPFHDKNPDVRAVSLKYFTGSGIESDILMTSGPGLIAREIEQFFHVAEVMAEEQASGEGLIDLVGKGIDDLQRRLIDKGVHEYEAVRIATAIAGRVVSRPPSLASLQYWGSVVQLGDFAAKVTLVPEPGVSADLTSDDSDGDFLGGDLEGRISAGGVRFTLRLVFFVNEELTPVNDATASWESSPAQTDVADIELLQGAGEGPTPQQIQAMAFDPNNGFTGLGITRVRDSIYRAGQAGRGISSPDEYRHFFQGVSDPLVGGGKRG